MRKIDGKTIISLTITVLACVLPAACGDDHNSSSASSGTQEEETRPEDSGQGFEGMLDLYGFAFRANEAEPFLTFAQPEDAGQGTVTVRNVGNTPSLTGTFEPNAGLLTISKGSRAGFIFDNFWGSTSEVGTVIRIEDDMVFQQDFPSSGDYFPTQGSFSYNSLVNKLTATIINDPPNIGVLLKMNNETPTFYTFNDFIDLLDTSTPEWQQKLGLVLSIFELLAEQAFFLADTANIINENKAVLADAGSMSFACSTFPQSDFAASQTLTWIDASGDGAVGQGDSFRWVFSRCRDNAENGLIDDLLNGQIDLNGYVFTTEQREGTDVTTRLGFEPADANTGGVVFTDLVQTEIDEPAPGRFAAVPKRSFTINGGYALLFSEAEQTP